MAIFDDAIDRKPINKTAGRVSAAGTHHEPTCTIACAHSELPLPTRPIPGGVKDLTGAKQGRLTVIGLSAKPRDGRGQLWVVRCTCGHYEERRTKSLLNERNRLDCCTICRTLAIRRRHHDYVTTGRERDIDWYLK